jgi:hypothetical protein
MKFAPLLAALSLGFLVAACESLDSPFNSLSSNPLLNTGRDARVYNGNTGSYEWPNTTPHPRPQPTPTAIAKAKATPTATPWKKVEPQKGAFVQGKTPAAIPGKAKATPEEVAAQATPSPVVAQATPVPAPAKGTGIFNLQTGKIEWATPAPSAPGAPAPQQ